MEKSARLRHLDALRGICAILVVLEHVVPKQWHGMGLVAADPQLYLDFGRIGVAAFFLISGYVIPFSIPRGEAPLRRFWISRFFRLWPAYWTAIALTVLIGPTRFPLRVLAVNCTMLQGFVGVRNIEELFWTLQIELVFYVLITVLIAAALAGKIKTYRWAFAVCIAASLVTAAARLLLHRELPVALPMGLTLMFLAASLRTLRLTGGPFPWGMVTWYVVSLVPICLLGYSVRMRVHDDPYRWILAYMVALATFLVFERMTDAPGYAVFLGAISYSVYLLHPIAMHFIRRVGANWGPIAQTGVVLALTIAGASLVFQFIEKPSQRFGKKLANKLKPAPAEEHALQMTATSVNG